MRTYKKFLLDEGFTFPLATETDIVDYNDNYFGLTQGWTKTRLKEFLGWLKKNGIEK